MRTSHCKAESICLEPIHLPYALCRFVRLWMSLWSSIHCGADTTTSHSVQLRHFHFSLRTPKIHQLHTIMVPHMWNGQPVHNHILRFKVTMCNTLAMQIPNPSCHLHHHVNCRSD
ncbi:hypothetical protein M758_5G152400 [Ceratodon purpureus]|nr:hypothetical protein M758_5G152400 [Ceratodon purpureus]